MVILGLFLGFGIKPLVSEAATPEVYVEPPMDFVETDLKIVLGAIFNSVKQQYTIENPAIIENQKVTIQLMEKKLLTDVLDTVLGPKNIPWSFDERMGLFRIAKSEKGAGKKGKTVVKIIPLTYATATPDIVKLVKSALSEQGTVNTDIGTNSLVISDVPEMFDGIMEIIKQVDIEGRREKLIQVKVKLIETTESVNKQCSVNTVWTHTPSGNFQFYGLTALLGPGPASGNGIYTTKALQYTSNLDTITWTVFLSKTVDSVEMVAEPDLMVEDGVQAVITVGKKEPVLTQTVSGGVITVSFTYQDVNVILTVTPQARRDGTIALELEPEINEIAGYVYSEQISVPKLDHRNVRTKLYVKNGGTFRLGGLTKDRTTTSESRIPILGDIPLLGLFFKYTQPHHEKIDLVMLVNPHIVDFTPPRSKDTPWIGKLESIQNEGSTDVTLDWSRDVPWGANGIFAYRIYRDTEPITSLEDREPLRSDVSGDATSWVDTEKKKIGNTYYYVVTAVNQSDMEQAISSDPKYNAFVEIHEPTVR